MAKLRRTMFFFTEGIQPIIDSQLRTVARFLDFSER